MAIDALTTSGINSLVNSFIQSESLKRVTPLKERQTRFNKLSSAYSSLLSQINALKNSLSALKDTSKNNVFNSKTVKSSNESRINASVSSNAIAGSYNLRVNQLAKNDTVLSLDTISNSYTSITSPGNYSFRIKSGDGLGNNFNALVTLKLQASDFDSTGIKFSSLANKISQAFNNDSAEIESSLVSGTNSSSGNFKFVIGGIEHTINYSAGGYEDVIDEIVNQLDDITGVTAEKVTTGGSFGIKINASDSSKYIQMKDDSGSLLSSLGISNDKFISASRIASISVFSPESGRTQISLSTKNTGYDFRFTELSDISTGGLLNEFGINFGTVRTSFVQNTGGTDTPGYLYSTSQLNSKLTLNGVQIDRNSNKVNDLIEGVNLNLLSLSEAGEADITLTISNNSSEIKSKIENFITNFNNIYKYLRDNLSSAKDKRGLLIGDSNAGSLVNLLSSYAVNPLLGFSSSVINSLSKLGITFNVNSGISISDESQLLNSIQNKLTEVEDFFNNSSNGFAKKLFDAVDAYTGAEGFLTKAQLQLNSTINFLNDNIKNSEMRIQKSADRLRAQYQRLQSQLATLLSNQSYFMGNIFNQQGF